MESEMRIKTYLLLIVIVLMLTLAIPTFAQDVTDEPAPTQEVVTPAPTPVIVEPPPPNPIPDDPTEPPATTPETLLGQLYTLLKDGTYIIWAAAGVVVIVGLIKVLASAVGIQISGSGAMLLTLVVQVVIWLAYATANYFGQGDAFKAWYLQVVDVLRALLPLAGSIFAGQIFYKQSVKRAVPVLGFRA
jgi:hypothetical protein